MSANVTMYATPYCPFCMRARQLLDAKGIEFTELRVDRDPSLRRQMMERSGRRTVPQIFVDDSHLGGFDDMHALDAAGKLDELLGL